MPAQRYARGAIDDIDRLADFLREDDPAAAVETYQLLARGLALLEQHPLIGYEVERGWRQLVISRGRSGYLALYEYLPALDRVVVHRIRHQREAGFQDD